MSRGSMRFALDELKPAMRAQVERKMAQLRIAAQSERVHVVPGPNIKADVLHTKKGPGKRRPPQIPKLSSPEERLAMHLKAEGLDQTVKRQYRWHPERKYRADFAYPAVKLLIEVQGGTSVRGRRSHTGSDGYEKDRRRQNEACILGFKVLEFTTRHVKSGYAVLTIRRALEAFGGLVRAATG